MGAHSSCVAQETLSSGAAPASHRIGLSCSGAEARGMWASVVASHGL